MASRNIIKVAIIGDESKLHSATNAAQRDLSKTSTAHSKMASAGKAAFFAIGTAAIGFGAIAVKASLEDSKSQTLLAKALQNTTGANKKQIAGVEDWIT